jgi:hypothetical protein
MREAMNNEATPAVGLYFREERPTLDDALEMLVKKAGGEQHGLRAGRARKIR